MAENPGRDVPAAEIDAGTRAIMEHLAERCNVGVGAGWIKLTFMDGELLYMTHEGKVPGKAVDSRFPAPT